MVLFNHFRLESISIQITAKNVVSIVSHISMTIHAPFITPGVPNYPIAYIFFFINPESN